MNARWADSVSQPLILPVKSRCAEEEASVRTSAPPIEWPMTKVGIKGSRESCEFIMWERSDRTRDVGPVWPF